MCNGVFNKIINTIKTTKEYITLGMPYTHIQVILSFHTIVKEPIY